MNLADTTSNLGHFTDIGLPPGQTRTAPWNTHNVAESQFKAFNTVLLDNRMNKR